MWFYRRLLLMLKRKWVSNFGWLLSPMVLIESFLRLMVSILRLMIRLLRQMIRLLSLMVRFLRLPGLLSWL